MLHFHYVQPVPAILMIRKSQENSFKAKPMSIVLCVCFFGNLVSMELNVKHTGKYEMVTANEE